MELCSQLDTRTLPYNGIFALYSDQTGLIRDLRVHTLSPIIMFKYCFNVQCYVEKKMKF